MVGALELYQLYIGTDPWIAIFSMVGILVTFIPLHLNGRDLYSICAMTFGLRYLGVALVLKTAYGQTLQSHLLAPFESHVWVFVIMAVVTAVILAVRHFDNGVDTFAFPNDPASLRRLAIISYCVGFVAMFVVATKSALSGSSGSFYMTAGILQNLLILAFVAEATRSLQVSQGRHLFSPMLIGMMVVTFLAVSSLNARGFFLNMAIGVVLVGFMHRAIKWRYVLVGLAFGAIFVNVLTPVILYTRAQKNLPLPQFIQYSLETGLRAATDPDFLKYIQVTASAKSEDTDDVEYDYYGDRSNVANRLSFIGLFNSIYKVSKDVTPLRMKAVRQSLKGISPGFMGFDKNPESLGDWLGWHIGLVEPGLQPYINFGLAMEGFTTWGWIGIIAYPILFIFPYLFVFSKIASFQLAVPTSIFVFSGIQHTIIETTSDGLVNGITRSAPVIAAFLFLLHYLFFRSVKRARAPAIAAPAQT